MTEDSLSSPPSLLGTLGRVLVALGAFLLLLLVVGVILVKFVAEPHYHGNEAAAVGSLKTLITAEQLFREADKDGDGAADHGDLGELGQADLIDAILCSGTKQGYLFTCRVRPDGGWTATAAPAVKGRTGDRWFAVDEQAAIHVSDEGPVPLGPRGEVQPDGSPVLGAGH